MFNTPILYIIFNRLDTVKQTFSQIQKIQPKKLYIAADGPRPTKENESQKCEEVKNWVLSNINWDCIVHTKFREQNAGCGTNVFEAIQWFFDNVEQGIILEDDCLPDLSFFPYCEELLNRYKNNPKIGLISGRNNANNSFCNNDFSYQFTTGGGIWGWATWSKNFNNFDAFKDYYSTKKLYKNILNFTKDKYETKFIIDQYKKAIINKDAWDYQWGIYLKNNHLLAITPSTNLIHNIGFQGVSTHYTNSNITDIESHSINFPLIHPQKIVPNYKLSKTIASYCYPKAENTIQHLLSKLLNYIKSIIKFIIRYKR